MDKIRQTDNSMLECKIRLRLLTLESIDKDTIHILDAFTGNMVVWQQIKSRTKKKLNILRIDAKPDRDGLYLVGDNQKFIQSLDLARFDIIDLDAYGSPYKQLKILFERGYAGYVICTFIQTMAGRLDNELLTSLGYTASMINKIPTLFSRNGLQKMLHYLNMNGVDEITGYFTGRKNYFTFKVGD